MRHVNFFKHPASESLYIAQVVFATVIGITVIVLSYRAYRRTKFLGFALWIVSSAISVGGTVGWDVVGHAYSYPRLYPAAVIAYRIVYLINSAVSFVGTILIIRQFLRLSESQRR